MEDHVLRTVLRIIWKDTNENYRFLFGLDTLPIRSDKNTHSLLWQAKCETGTGAPPWRQPCGTI